MKKLRSWALLQSRMGWVVFFTVCLASLFAPSVQAAGKTGIEEGDIKQHDLFEFEAFIKHDDISDGTEPFDSDNEPGNDAGEHNNIVRSWDTVTYPLKITVNPKKADMLENIKLQISGELENGVTGKRVNAKFAVGGKESVKDQTVRFVQDYTIERTGNSIMIPIAVEVKGAKPGVVLTPKLKVQVVSVDGENIEESDITTHFDELPGVEVSAKVNIRPKVGSGLAGQGLPYYPYAGITGKEADKENVHAFALSWSMTKLPGKTSMKGATAPDPDGTINYTIDLSGTVTWDNPKKKESLNFNGRDTPFQLLDHRPISTVQTSIGSPNTLLDGQSYRFNRPYRYTAPMSSMTESKRQSESWTRRSVWDSGNWEVDTPDIQSNKVTYHGSNTGYEIGSTFPYHRADGYSGSRIYGVNDNVFASHSFLVLMANEYRIGGPNNPDDRSNNVHYKATVHLVSYTDENGKGTPFEQTLSGSKTFTERNDPSGNMFVKHTFHSHPGNKQLGTPVVGDSVQSKGDVSTLMGEDVNWVGYFLHRIPLPGGYSNVYRWNTDAFELTKAYADWAEDYIYGVGYYNYALERITHDKEHQTMYYGVATFDDNSFEQFTKKGKDDYDWYETYDEAVKHGPVGAMLNDVHTFIPPSHRSIRVPLRVKQENIGMGAATKDGTANIAVTNAYAYLDEERTKEIDVSANQAYHNPAIWDDTGTMTKKQSPAGGHTNFETLAVLPAETASVLKTNQSSYYNSETIQWTAKNSIVLPVSGVPDDLDSGVTVRHILPKGLNYKTGSGMVGEEQIEPEIITNTEGTTELVWDLLVSNHTHALEDITFQTTINPFALSNTGVQSSVTVESVIESDLDRRQEHLRTSSHSVTVLKVGMVGIYESINQLHGDKNSDYMVTLSPYTTIEDEEGVTGLTHLPLSGDEIGSDYEGRAFIQKMDVRTDRLHEDKSVIIYLNRDPVYSDKPQDIDVSKDGWYEYTGDANQLDGAVSLLFYVDGKMTNKDTIEIDVTVQTEDNAFGNQYLNETVINSATDYKLSPVSNRVRYMIRADLELALERFQIYTNKADQGLPTSTRVTQTVLEPEEVNNKSITLAIYDTESGDKITETTYKQEELASENAMLIPPDGLEKGTHKNFEVRIEGYDENKIWVRDGEGALNTDGYTSEEKILTAEDIDEDGNLSFQGVVMTERERGKDSHVFQETLEVKQIPSPQVKAGYGFRFEPSLSYQNDQWNRIKGKVDTRYASDASLSLDRRLMDDSLEYAQSHSDTVTVPLLREETMNHTTYSSSYNVPSMYLEQYTGRMYTKNQKENGMIEGESIPAGQEIYVPVWIESTGRYDAAFQTDEPIGSHFTSVDVTRDVNVHGYMFQSADSDTISEDELLIHPILQDAIPEQWR